MHWKHYLAAGLVGLIGSGALPAQVVRTWTGSTSSDWFNASNWSPAGVPAGTDTVNVTNGTVNLTAPVTSSGKFNWAGGTLQGNALTIGNGGLLTIVAAGSQATLQTSLTNARVKAQIAESEGEADFRCRSSATLHREELG
jgi:hypothetical protein